MEVFWHNIRFILFLLLPCMNLGAFITWKQFMYEDKARGLNEKKRKRDNKISLIILLIMCNLVPLYFILSMIYEQFFAS